jgi:hypothetical protein
MSSVDDEQTQRAHGHEAPRPGTSVSVVNQAAGLVIARVAVVQVFDSDAGDRLQVVWEMDAQLLGVLREDAEAGVPLPRTGVQCAAKASRFT